MNHRTTYPGLPRRLAIVTGTLAASIAVTLGGIAAAAHVAADSKPVKFGTPLTTEQIDVLTEGDDWDHPWEQCRINSDYWVFCPDGSRVEYPVPSPATDEPNAEDTGGVLDPGAKAAALDLDRCEGPDDEPTNLPCRVPMRETYVVGGDGATHLGCVIVLLDAEDSEMVCRDDTVWAS